MIGYPAARRVDRGEQTGGAEHKHVGAGAAVARQQRQRPVACSLTFVYGSMHGNEDDFA